MGMKHLAFAALLLAAAPAHAQQARVVAACGSLAPFGPIAAGGQAYPTIDVNGQLCLSGGGGGGGITSITANSTPTTGFTAGQFMYSDGSKVQASAKMVQDISGFAGINFTDGASNFLANIGSNPGLTLAAGAPLAFSGSYPINAYTDTTIYRDGVGILGQRRLTAPQALRVYNTFTDASNGEWGGFDWQTTPNTLTIGTQRNGTGVGRGVQIYSSAFGAPIAKFDVSPGFIEFQRTTSVNAPLTVMNANLNLGGVGGSLFNNGAYVAGGTQPTITGSGGTCATTTKVGGATAGTVVLSAVCASTNTIVFTGMPAVTNGFACDAEDRTTIGAGPFIETASTTTGFTLTVGATPSVANDVLQWKCTGY